MALSQHRVDKHERHESEAKVGSGYGEVLQIPWLIYFAYIFVLMYTQGWHMIKKYSRSK